MTAKITIPITGPVWPMAVATAPSVPLRSGRERTVLAGRLAGGGGRGGRRGPAPVGPREDQVGHQGGPAGLVRCPEATARVAVEVLVEDRQLPPVGVGLEAGQPSRAR